MTSRFRSIGLAVRIEPVREFPQRSPFIDAFGRITGASVFVKGKLFEQKRLGRADGGFWSSNEEL